MCAGLINFPRIRVSPQWWIQDLEKEGLVRKACSEILLIDIHECFFYAFFRSSPAMSTVEILAQKCSYNAAASI